ncbi:hypothetical protein ACH5RR_040961 [Cinchona calisaya]|uniref:Uncharacterized protein n=1 Tax=Cinchona calisaya TaxID=153742 RepID=A0ABD2XY83_9GENT
MIVAMIGGEEEDRLHCSINCWHDIDDWFYGVRGKKKGRSSSAVLQLVAIYRYAWGRRRRCEASGVAAVI